MSLRLARVLFAAFVVSILAGCGNSDDGQVLSDEQKLEKFNAGRKAQGQTGGAPGTPGATNP